MEPFQPRRRVSWVMPPVLPFRTRSAVSPYRRARPDALNFEDLLRPQVEYLYRLAWRFTGSVADAEDLVQDVLIKLFPRTQELLEIERLRPWLARVSTTSTSTRSANAPARRSWSSWPKLKARTTPSMHCPLRRAARKRTPNAAG